MSAATRTVDVAATPEVVWDVLADFDAIAAWAPDVDHSSLLRRPPDGAGVGTSRRVQIDRTTLIETIDRWDEGTAIGYGIEGLPPVVRSARNDWRLGACGPGTRVELTSTVDAGPRPPQRLIARLVAARMARGSESMLDGLARHVSSRPTLASEERR